HAARGFTLPYQCTALSLPGQSQEIGVTKALANRGSVDECSVGHGGIASVDLTIANWQEQIALLHAVGLVVKQSLGPGKPAAGLGGLAADQRYEAQPKSGACRWP